MYKGKTVLITGTDKGVGRGITEYFLKHNATVIGLSRTLPDFDEARYSHFVSDISDPDDILSVFSMLSELKTKIDICINNAAVLTSQYALKMPVASIIDMINVNLLAVIMISRESAKLMRNDYGRIINISSMAVALEPQGDSVYAATKAGMNTFTNIIAKEFQMLNVTCNTLAISAIETDMLRQLNKEKVDKVIAALPIPRYANIEDITNVIYLFASEKSNYITAQTIYLGGVHK
jgi:3-oxoacyl-[acyl-carrier protein] reductase